MIDEWFGIMSFRFYLPHIMESSGVMDRATAMLGKKKKDPSSYPILLYSSVVLVGNGLIALVNFLGTLPCFWFVSGRRTNIILHELH